MIRSLVAALSLAALALAPSAASAAQPQPYCYGRIFDNNSGWCYGTIASFSALAQTSPVNSTFAQFTYDGTVASFFSASINYANYYCNASLAQLPLFAVAATLPQDTYFYVEWNSSHACTRLQFRNDSSLK